MPKAAGLFVLALALLLSSCSSSTPAPAAAPKAAPATGAATPSGNPVAKYIELVGFRMEEKGPGKLNIRFGVVNHSDADVGELTLTVNMRTTAAQAGSAPLFTFPAKVNLGPSELKEVQVEVPTKMRVYELPDWQFLRSDFVVTSPQ